jgi:hypothetical protein
LRGLRDDHLLDSPRPELLYAVTGIPPDRSGKHATLTPAGVRSTQRLGPGTVGGGVVVFTWPAELREQARYVYRGDRGARLLEAAAAGGWDVDTRPHLAYWLAPARDRLYMNPQPSMMVGEYVARWAGPDGRMIGGHRLDTVRDELWPWLLERGYATDQDTELLEPFLGRVRKGNRDAHLRPGLRLMRRWSPEAVAELDRAGKLAEHIRRPKIARTLARTPKLAARIGASMRIVDGRVVTEAETDRVDRVFEKLARGLYAFEMGEPAADMDAAVRVSPIEALDQDALAAFATLAAPGLLPEVGSRMMQRVIVLDERRAVNDWVEVQPGQFEYARKLRRWRARSSSSRDFSPSRSRF